MTAMPEQETTQPQPEPEPPLEDERASMEWTGLPLAVTILDHLQHALDVMRSTSSDDPQQAQCFAEIETLLICAVSELVGPRPLTHRSRRHVPREFP